MSLGEELNICLSEAKHGFSPLKVKMQETVGFPLQADRAPAKKGLLGAWGIRKRVITGRGSHVHVHMGTQT